MNARLYFISICTTFTVEYYGIANTPILGWVQIEVLPQINSLKSASTKDIGN